jgi:hypothetical protein
MAFSVGNFQLKVLAAAVSQARINMQIEAALRAGKKKTKKRKAGEDVSVCRVANARRLIDVLLSRNRTWINWQTKRWSG